MSLDKSIQHGKDKRREYRGAKRIDRQCRNHGRCEYCIGNRTHKFRDRHPPEDTSQEHIAFVRNIYNPSDNVCEHWMEAHERVSESVVSIQYTDDGFCAGINTTFDV